MRLVRCASTVFTLISRAVATSLLLRPCANSFTTSRSRGVRALGDGPGVLVLAKWPSMIFVTAGGKNRSFLSPAGTARRRTQPTPALHHHAPPPPPPAPLAACAAA